MDLFICGHNPLLEYRQSAPCKRWHRSFSNKCTHVPPGQVEAGSNYQICPLSALTPIHVLSSERSVGVIATEAQNLVIVDDEKVLWTSDGVYDIRRDFGTKHMTLSQLLQIQDMWPEPNMERAMESIFDDGPDYIPLGLLTQDGAIYAINQEVEPGFFAEKTSSRTRRPFRHVLIRQEVNNMKGDTWPHVVFEEQPRTIYRLETVGDLLRWLDGKAASFSTLTFPSKIAQLLTSGGVRGEECMTLTDEGKIYYWARGAPFPSRTGILSKELDLSPTPEEASASIGSEEDENANANERLSLFQCIPMPPVAHLVAGPTYGAAITTTGQLYIFLTRRPRRNTQNECVEPTLAELYIPPSSTCADNKPISAVYPPYTPQVAQILEQATSPSPNPNPNPNPTTITKIVDVAVGYNHLVALTSDGQVFTAGDGMYGQIGVGEEQQFNLHATKHQMNESEESWEFAEYWQEVDIVAEEERGSVKDENEIEEGTTTRRKTTERKKVVVAVHAGFESTLLIVN